MCSNALDRAKSLTQYTHRIWDQQEGLLQPTVYSILQSRSGFLWLGTQDSLIRFDGARFREYDESAQALLHRALVRSLLEDRHGNLWAGTIGSGLVRISPQRTVMRFGIAQGFPGANAFCLVQGSGDDLWICATEGLVRLREGKFQLFAAAGTPRATCETKPGERWVATDNGLERETNGHFQPFTDAMLPPGRPVNALQCDSAGVVWAGTGAGLLRIDGGKARLLTTGDGLPDNDVLTLAPGSGGSLWIGTNDGISRLQDRRISAYRTTDGLSHSLVLSLLEDREGTLWAGTKNGLDQFTDGDVTPYTEHEGLSKNDAGPVAQDKTGKLWVGTLGGGLNVYDGSRFRALTKRNGLLDDNILSLAVDETGDVWAGSARGVNRLHNGRVMAAYTRQQGLSGDEVRSLLVDADGAVWAGTERGLDQLNGGRFVPSHLLDGRSADGIVGMFPGVQVKLFISTERPGFYVLRDGKLTDFQTDVNRPADCMFLDRDQHAAWLGTLGSGLLRWKGGTLRHVRVKDGLYDNRIYGILRDDDRNFWLASSKGIFRVSQRELDDFADGKIPFVNSIPFTTGQLRFECQSGVQPAAVRTRDGRMWFSTTNGVVMVDPAHHAGNGIAPVVQMDGVLVNGEPTRRTVPGQELQLNPFEKNIEIRYAGLSFLAPEKVRFRYMLQGFDKGWMDAGNRREAFFTNLPPGHFVFKVMARSADGVWSNEPAVLPFAVAPRLYQRVSFFLAMAALLGLIGFVAYRLRIRQLERTFQAILSERSRIARELHDTLLQGLSGVTMQLQALFVKLPQSKEKHWLAEIIKDASRASTEARQSLWGLRTTQAGLPEFAGKLRKAVEQMTMGAGLAVDMELEEVRLRSNPELEYQLLRIAHEAVANVLAHAEARRLVVTLTTENGWLWLTIADDGIGFRHEGTKPFGHYGLVGMQERATEIRGRMTIDSTPGAGTRVSVSVPFRRDYETKPSQGNAETAGMHHRE